MKMRSVPAPWMSLTPGVYSARLLSIEERDPGPDSPFPEPYWRWEFELVSDEHPDGILKFGSSSCNFSPKSKARKWLEAVLGRSIPEGEEVDSEALCPIECQVVLRKEEGKDTTKVADVFGAPKAVKRPAAAAAAAAAKPSPKTGEGEDF